MYLASGFVRKDASEVSVSAQGATASAVGGKPGCAQLKAKDDVETAAVQLVCEHWPASLGDFSDEFSDGAKFYKDVLGKDGYLSTAKAFLANLKQHQNFCWPKFTPRPGSTSACPAKVSENPKEVAAGTFSAPSEVAAGTFVAPTPERSITSLGRSVCWKDCRDVCGTNETYDATNAVLFCLCATGEDNGWHLISRSAPAATKYEDCPAGTKSVHLDAAECRATCSGEFKHVCGLTCAKDKAGCIDAMEERAENFLSGIMETTTSVLKLSGGGKAHALIGQAINVGVVQTFEVLRVVTKDVLAKIATAEKAGAAPRSKKLAEAVVVALLLDLDQHKTDASTMAASAERYVAAVVKAAKGEDEEGTAASSVYTAAAAAAAKGVLHGPEKLVKAFYAAQCTA